jgi:hypothetical protein
MKNVSNISLRKCAGNTRICWRFRLYLSFP